MKWLLFGVLLGVLVLYPALLPQVIGLVTAVASKPVAVAFTAGLLIGPRLNRGSTT